MPRIATAFWVVAAISVSIGVNTYRYPVVREMAAATPRLRLPAVPTPKPDASPAPSAAADPSRSAPERTHETAQARPTLPLPESGLVSQSTVRCEGGICWMTPEEHVSNVPRTTRSSATPPAEPPPELPPKMPDAGLAFGGDSPASPGVAASDTAVLPAGEGPTDLPTIERQAATAMKPDASVDPGPWRPLARLTASGEERVAIPAESRGARSGVPNASTLAEPDDGVKRLPPVKQDWTANFHGGQAAYPGTAPPVYPTTGAE